MTVRRLTSRGWAAELGRSRRLDTVALDGVRESVREIVEAVRAGGDERLFHFSRKFDGWAPGAGEPLGVGPGEMQAAFRRLEPSPRQALELAAQRIREFHAHQRFEPVVGPPGIRLVTRPVDSAGLYVPGGRAAYPSSVLMTAIPARVAGVPRVSLATPPAADGSVPAAVLAAAHLAEVDVVYRVGGAQAIAALAFGTGSVEAVDMIAGPGNAYVTQAKREVYGVVGIDSLAGPTEIMILADRTARADYVAADLASQMEHDPLVEAVLLSDSDALIDAVAEEMGPLTEKLERRQVVEAARCSLVRVDSIEEGLELVNRYAPEHLEIIAADHDRLAQGVRNAGAIFVGEWAPVALGDYVIGPNHTLPTAGGARFCSPLGVAAFLKRTSVVSLTRGEFAALEEPARTLASLEGLGAHANAVAARRRTDREETK